MKNFKRIMAFMMAMIIFASFFCYNIGAVGRPFVPYPRNNTFVRENFSDTSAYACVVIRNWAEESNTTDLRAATYAHVNDYADLPYFYDALAYVSLTVHLADGSVNEDYIENFSEPDEGTVDAAVRGANCLNHEEHSEIVYFETSHYVDVYFASFDKHGNLVEYWILGDGPIITIYADTNS